MTNEWWWKKRRKKKRKKGAKKEKEEEKQGKVTWLVNSADSLWPLTTMAFVSQVNRFKVLLMLWRSGPSCVCLARLEASPVHSFFTELSNLDPVQTAFHTSPFTLHPAAYSNSNWMYPVSPTRSPQDKQTVISKCTLENVLIWNPFGTPFLSQIYTSNP